jgi:hypothetical protein
MAQVTQGESQEDEDFNLSDSDILDGEKAQVIELIHLARIDRDALDAEKALAASEKAMYESRIASMESLRDAEFEWVNTLKMHHHEKDRVIITMLTSHLPVDKAAETVALFKSKDEQLNVQGRFIDAYRTQYKCGLKQMAEMAYMYRTSLTDQADDHRTEITDLYERVTKLVEAGDCLKDQLKCAKATSCANIAAKHAKEAIEQLTAAKNAEKGATLLIAKAMLDKDTKAAAVIAAKEAEITRLTEELAAARGIAAMET